MRDLKAVELRAAGDRELAAADRAFERVVNLRLVGIEKNAALQIRQRNPLVAEIDGHRGVCYGCLARHARVLVRTTDVYVQPRHPRREKVGREQTENAQVHRAIYR